MDNQILDDSFEDAERFAEAILNLSLYDWQGQVLYDCSQLRDRRRIAVRAPNGAGKDDRIIGPLSLWWLRRFRRGQVVITTKDEKQLKNQTWRSISRYRNLFPDCETFRDHDCTIKTPTGGLLSAFVTDDAARAEGYHDAEPDGPLLIIVNEAKSVPDEIYDAFQRCTYSLLLEISSPGFKVGHFYRAFTENRAIYSTYAIGQKDCPHIPAAKIQQTVKEYGENDPFTRSTIFGEFMDEGPGEAFVCPLSWIESNLNASLGQVPGVRVAGLDWAAGGDKNALVIRNGNTAEELYAWRERDTKAAITTALMKLHQANLSPSHIWADADGLGLPMTQDLGHMGWKVNGFLGGRKSPSQRYKNLVSYVWHEVAARIRRHEIIVPRKHVLRDELIGQLSSRRAKFDAQGKLWMETKEEMRARGLASPDLADAFCIAFGVQPATSSSWIQQESNFAEIARSKGWDYRGGDSEGDGDSSQRPSSRDEETGGFGGVHSDW